jgi:hypothetical protein
MSLGSSRFLFPALSEIRTKLKPHPAQPIDPSVRGLLVVNRIVFIMSLLVFAHPLLHAQAVPTASRAGILQVGGGIVSADSSTTATNRFKGIFVFADLDVTPHFGVEFELHQVNTSNADHVYERTYETGVRYHRTYGRLEPYAKLMVGRGVFNYSNDAANLAYNLYATGIGADLRVTRHVNAHAGYEYQHWINFSPGTLSPSLVVVGAAYRF